MRMGNQLSAKQGGDGWEELTLRKSKKKKKKKKGCTYHPHFEIFFDFVSIKSKLGLYK
jgi:hypothetical protein